MLSFLDIAFKFVYSFKKQITFFYKIVKNSDFANVINFARFISGRDVGISDVVEVTIGMDRYFIVPDCALYVIYVLTYVCIVGVTFGEGVVVI